MNDGANTHRTSVSIVLPIYNEESALPELFGRLVAATDPLSSEYGFEFVLVDDGSRDQSLDVARNFLKTDARVRVVELRRNYGQTAALQAGLDEARGDIIISMDADLQHFPEEIPSFLERIEEGYDVVCGWRKDRREGVLRRWPSWVANVLIRRVSGLTIHDVGTTFRAYRADVIRDVRLLGEGHRFVPVFARAAGARITEIPIRNVERSSGKSNYGLGRTLHVFLDLMFIWFFLRYLDRPIRVFGALALWLFAFGGAIAAWLLWVWVRTGMAVVREHSGWFMVGVSLLLAGLQLLLTGVVAEMLAKVYYSGRERSPHKVRKVWMREGEGC